MKILLVLFLMLPACATVKRISENGFKRTPPKEDPPPELPPEKRFKEYIINTDESPAETYLRAKSWVTANMIRPEFQHDSTPEKLFVAKARIENCRALGLAVYEIRFVLNFQAKDGRYRLLFDQLSAIRQGIPQDFPIPSKIDELEQIGKNCLEPIRDNIVREIASVKSKSNW